MKIPIDKRDTGVKSHGEIRSAVFNLNSSWTSRETVARKSVFVQWKRVVNDIRVNGADREKVRRS